MNVELEGEPPTEDSDAFNLDKLLENEWFDPTNDFGYDSVQTLTYGTPYYLPEATPVKDTPENEHFKKWTKLTKGRLDDLSKDATEKIIFFLDSADTRGFLHRSDVGKSVIGNEAKEQKDTLGLWTVLLRSYGVRELLQTWYYEEEPPVDEKALFYDVLLREVKQMLLFLNGRAYGSKYLHGRFRHRAVDRQQDIENSTPWGKYIVTSVLDKIYPIKKPYVRLEKECYSIPIYQIFEKYVFGRSTKDEKEELASEETMLIMWLYCFMVTKNGTLGRTEPSGFVYPDIALSDHFRDHDPTVTAYRQTIIYALLYAIKRNMLNTFRKDFPFVPEKETEESDQKTPPNPMLFSDIEESRREWLSRSTVCYSILNKICMEMTKHRIGESFLCPKFYRLSVEEGKEDKYAGKVVMPMPVYFITKSDPSFWNLMIKDVVVSEAMHEYFLYPLDSTPTDDDEDEKEDKVEAVYQMFSNFIERYHLLIKETVKNDIETQDKERIRSKYSNDDKIDENSSIDYARVTSVDFWDEPPNSVEELGKGFSFAFRRALRTYYFHYQKRIEQVNFPFLLSLMVLNVEFFEWVDLDDPEFEWMKEIEGDMDVLGEKRLDGEPENLEFNCVFFDLWNRKKKPSYTKRYIRAPFKYMVATDEGKVVGPSVDAVHMNHRKFAKTFRKSHVDYELIRSMWRKNAIYEPKLPDIQNRQILKKNFSPMPKPLIRDRAFTLYDVMDRLMEDVAATTKDLYELGAGFGPGNLYHGKVFSFDNYVQGYKISFDNHSKEYLSSIRDEYIKEGNYLAVWFIEEILYAARWCYAARSPYDFKYTGSITKEYDVSDQRNGNNIGWFKDEFTKLLVVKNENYMQSKIN